MEKGISIVINANNDIDIVYNTKIIAKDDLKQLKITLENEDRSCKDIISNLENKKFEGTDQEVKCHCSYYSLLLETKIDIKIIYKVINRNLLQKKIELNQTNIPFLYYSIQNSIIPNEVPDKYWSFDNIDHNGGSVREVFPAIGYSVGNISVGQLLDSGYKNQWTRNIRRRPTYNKIGFTAIKEACDINLLRLPTITEREKNNHYVKVLFGEVIDFNNSKKEIVFNTNDSLCINSTEEYTFPIVLKDGFYNISFDYKGSEDISIKIYKDVNAEGKRQINGFDYHDNIKSECTSWTKFNDNVILLNTENKKSLIVFNGKNLSIKNLKITKLNGTHKPYHKLEQGNPCKKTVFIIAKELDRIRDIRYYSQVLLADGLGFKGSPYEKILYADMQMLTWITSANDFSPLNVPSINYAPDMYNRDSFWSTIGIDDKELSVAIWKKWGATQNSKGAIGTIITPYMGSLEVKGNDATCEWIWWAYINKIKYNIEPNMNAIKKAYEYCINEFDSDNDGIVKSHFVLGQNDVQTYFDSGKTSSLSVNQGVFAVTLKVAKKLGITVEDKYLDAAINGYRDFYDEETKYLLNNRDYKKAISVGDLMPEFMSIWLFDEGMLNKKIISNTLKKIPTINDCATFIGHVDDKYFSNNNSPFDSKFSWPKGVYYNGGSWLREEIMAYSIGVWYGLNEYKERIEKRIKKEIDLIEDDPVSHEFLPTNLNQKGCIWESARVFSWNVFILKAIELTKINGAKKGE